MWGDRRTGCNRIGGQTSSSTDLFASKLPGHIEDLYSRIPNGGGDCAHESRYRGLHPPHSPPAEIDLGSVNARQTGLCSPVLDPHVPFFINGERYTSKYVPVRSRTVNREEQEARRIARGLKTGAEEAIRMAALCMAALIDGPCWLVPVPASDGSLTANLKLATAIAALVPGARVNCAVARVHPVESSCRRRAVGQFSLTPTQHAIVRIAGPMQAWPVYFVDNVITSGATIAACRRALGWGTALTYADAGTWRNTRPRSTG